MTSLRKTASAVCTLSLMLLCNLAVAQECSSQAEPNLSALDSLLQVETTSDTEAKPLNCTQLAQALEGCDEADLECRRPFLQSSEHAAVEAYISLDECLDDCAGDIPCNARVCGDEWFDCYAKLPPGAGSVPTRDKEKALAQTLETKSNGLLYTSESDYPYAGFHKYLPSTVPLTENTFRTLLGISSNKPVSIYSAQDFWNYYTDAQIHGAAEANQYKALKQAMESDLKDIQVINVGGWDDVEHAVYLVGRSSNGTLVGLKTVSIET